MRPVCCPTSVQGDPRSQATFTYNTTASLTAGMALRGEAQDPWSPALQRQGEEAGVVYLGPGFWWGMDK